MANDDHLQRNIECYFSRLEQIRSIGHETIALYASSFVKRAAVSRDNDEDADYEKLLKEDPNSPVHTGQGKLFSSLWENPVAVIGQAIDSARHCGMQSDTNWLLIGGSADVVRCVHSVWHMKGVFRDQFRAIFPECPNPEHIPFVLFFKEFHKYDANPMARSRQACLAKYDSSALDFPGPVVTFCQGVVYPLVEQTAESVRGILHVIIQTAKRNAASEAERNVAATCNGSGRAANGDARSVCWRDVLKAAEGYEKRIVDLGLVFGWGEIDYDGSIRKQLDAFIAEFGYDDD